GVRVLNLDWVAADRRGLSICDATSAVFAMDVEWSKVDVVTWSWQKVLGGEGAHGMIALSPKALARLEEAKPRALPRIFQLNKGVYEGDTINTPSMMCVEDALDGLKWAESVGGLPGLIARSQANLKAIETWVATSTWASFLAKDPATRSSTSICLSANADVKAIAAKLEAEGVAYDIGSYRDAPAGLRIWGGATVETSDIVALLPWLDWAQRQTS
ncbi:MAG: phosphoserine aminotransferase, partial [Acidobacteria bacterium]|nr:phosphoserine aminotransferase [Acidobacteriota bacterium]